MQRAGKLYGLGDMGIDLVTRLFDSSGYSLKHISERGGSYHVLGKEDNKITGNLRVTDMGTYVNAFTEDFNGFVEKIRYNDVTDELVNSKLIGQSYGALIEDSSAICYKLETSGFKFEKATKEHDDGSMTELKDRFNVMKDGIKVGEMSARTKYTPHKVFLEVYEGADELAKIAEEYKVLDDEKIGVPVSGAYRNAVEMRKQLREAGDNIRYSVPTEPEPVPDTSKIEGYRSPVAEEPVIEPEVYESEFDDDGFIYPGEDRSNYFTKEDMNDILRGAGIEPAEPRGHNILTEEEKTDILRYTMHGHTPVGEADAFAAAARDYTDLDIMEFPLDPEVHEYEYWELEYGMCDKQPAV